jgi:hypothetical protein
MTCADILFNQCSSNADFYGMAAAASHVIMAGNLIINRYHERLTGII